MVAARAASRSRSAPTARGEQQDEEKWCVRMVAARAGWRTNAIMVSGEGVVQRRWLWARFIVAHVEEHADASGGTEYGKHRQGSEGRVRRGGKGVLPAVYSPHSVPSGFALLEGETVRLLLGPDREDRLASGVSVATGIAVVGILKYLEDLAGGMRCPIAGVGLWLALSVVIGLLFVILTTSGDVMAIVTDRGIRVRNQDGSELIPWDDIISVDASLPYLRNTGAPTAARVLPRWTGGLRREGWAG